MISGSWVSVTPAEMMKNLSRKIMLFRSLLSVAALHVDSGTSSFHSPCIANLV
eukprot:TRINITY_DN1905_c0_g1_i1.p4 TRINITY_DN1905_c0_g1~~TRINITY_DN1905_c0_g1_i1.p4  ORF type:complete len:53 (-),score=2.98 TRINITY_DN1905_c0_g1_i1:500-658(-)